MLPYAHDEVSEEAYVKMPEVVVKPGTKEEIASIMKLANREMIPVTPVSYTHLDVYKRQEAFSLYQSPHGKALRFLSALV